MGVTAAADYLVSLCAQLAMLLSYQWLCHCCFRLVRHNLELILVVWLFQAFTTTTQCACCPQASSTAAPRRQASQQALRYRQMMHTTCSLLKKKEFFTRWFLCSTKRRHRKLVKMKALTWRRQSEWLYAT